MEERYARVEVMGHRTHVGRVTEISQFGATMVQIEEPEKGSFDQPCTVIAYSGAAIFSVRWVDRAEAEGYHRQYLPYERAARELPPPEKEDDFDPPPRDYQLDEDNPF